MKTAPPLALAALAAVAATVLSAGCARAMAQDGPRRAPAGGRGPIELTVYSADFGMVRETRRVELAPGRARLGIQGVSKALDQNSVMFDWPSRKDARVVSSAYDLGVGNSGRLLARFVGREVELVYRGQDGRVGERVKGVLQVAEPGNVVVLADGRYVVNPTATIEAPSDAGIVTIPQLSAEIESPTGGATELGVSYMTGGLSWSADYTATLAPGSDRLSLEGWATVTNRTGTDFPDATIRFVAGAPNRVLKETRARSLPAADAGAAAAPARGRIEAFAPPEAVGELVAYPYASKATIRQDGMNRVRMMGSDSVAVKRVYSIALPALDREYDAFGGNPDRRLRATMGINFANAKDAGLGLPLPAGAVRVYEPDASGASRYVGAAPLGDTPKDARVSLELTNVFNVYARARQISATRLDKRHTSRTVEITVNNEKAKPVEVRLVEGFGGTWKIAGETSKSRRLNASTAEWTLTVPAGGETKLRYTVVLGP